MAQRGLIQVCMLGRHGKQARRLAAALAIAKRARSNPSNTPISLVQNIPPLGAATAAVAPDLQHRCSAMHRMNPKPLGCYGSMLGLLIAHGSSGLLKRKTDRLLHLPPLKFVRCRTTAVAMQPAASQLCSVPVSHCFAVAANNNTARLPPRALRKKMLPGKSTPSL